MGAAQDGTAIGAIAPGAITAPLFVEQFLYDARPLIYLGSAKSEFLNCFVRTDAPVETFQDVFTGELVIGAPAPRDTGYDFPNLENKIFGTRFRIIAGYRGTNDVHLAVNRGEAQGICGASIFSMSTTSPDWLPSGFAKILVQESLEGSKELNEQGIPRTGDFAKTREDRDVMKLIYEQQKFGRPYALPPGVPVDRVRALRRAFQQTLQDQEFLAAASKMRLPLAFTSGEETQKLVDAVFDTPSAINNELSRHWGTAKANRDSYDQYFR